MRLRRLLYILLFALLCNFTVYCQGYGLRFYGQEYELNERTSLELFPEKNYKLKQQFKLSFDLSFVRGYNSYFGYIFRIITDDGINLDLIYENKFDTLTTLNLILSDRESPLSLNLDIASFYDWKDITIEFDFQDKVLLFGINDTIYSLPGLDISKGDKLKIFFGQCYYGNFKSTDLPNMKIRDIKLYENQKLKHSWPLNELQGEVAYDIIKSTNALVKKPYWMHQMHLNWTLEHRFKVDGYTQVVHNPENEELLIVSPDSIILLSTFDTNYREVFTYKERFNIFRGIQIHYDTTSDQLFSFSIDLKSVQRFKRSERKWDNNFPLEAGLTQFHHHNKYYNPLGNTLYLFGGYGQLTYKNTLLKVNFDTGQWEVKENPSKEFIPRYLHGLGENETLDTIYIIGGYGSVTGDQKINPGNIYDLVRYLPGEDKFEKVYELRDNRPDDFCFANSIIIEKETNSYYGLIFSKYEYNGTLQLIRGSLSIPEFTYLAKPIPFTFHDIMSYADLFYSEKNKKLIAATMFHKDNDETDVEIYSLYFPPTPRGGVMEVKEKETGLIKILIIGVGFIIAVVIVVINRNRRKKGVQKVTPVEETEKTDIYVHKEEKSVISKKSETVIYTKKDVDEQPSPRITLFGGFQVIDVEGNDLTSQFTPLLKELFLLILLNSLQNKKGVSTHKLKEILWFDKSDKDARNNRAVNIARLKGLLKKVGKIEVSKLTGYWKIDILSDDVYLDYLEYQDIVTSENLTMESIQRLIHITTNGSLLFNLDYEWLDDFKADVSNNIIDSLIQFADENIQKCEPNFLIHIADSLFSFDAVNEEAMILKCKTLVKLGKHSLAKNTYTKFCKEYKVLYDQDYSISFNEITDKV